MDPNQEGPKMARSYKPKNRLQAARYGGAHLQTKALKKLWYQEASTLPVRD